MDGSLPIPHPVRVRNRPDATGLFAFWLRNSFFIPSGMGAGQPFMLHKFQLDFIRQFLSRDPDGPRWRTCIYSTPRKLGKSTLLGAMLLGLMCPDSPIYIRGFVGAVAAPSEKHATYIAKAMVEIMNRHSPSGLPLDFKIA